MNQRIVDTLMTAYGLRMRHDTTTEVYQCWKDRFDVAVRALNRGSDKDIVAAVEEANRYAPRPRTPPSLCA